MIELIQTGILGTLAIILAINTFYLSSVVSDLEKMVKRHDSEIEDLQDSEKGIIQ